MHFGIVFENSGGLPLPKRSPQRQAYRMQELERWRSELGIPLNKTPAHFPANDQTASTVVYAAKEAGGDALALANAIGLAQWCEEKDFSDDATLKAIADSVGLDGAALLERANDPQIRAKYTDLAQIALDSGVFGAPTYLYNGEMFWGQDRLDFLDRALAG